MVKDIYRSEFFRSQTCSSDNINLHIHMFKKKIYRRPNKKYEILSSFVTLGQARINHGLIKV